MNGVGSFVICPVTAPSVLKMATCESTVSVAFVDESESCPSCQREVVSDSLELSNFSFLASKSSRSDGYGCWETAIAVFSLRFHVTTSPL